MCRFLKSKMFLIAPYESLLSSFLVEHLSPACSLLCLPLPDPSLPPSPFWHCHLHVPRSTCPQCGTEPLWTHLWSPYQCSRNPTVVFSWALWSPRPSLVCCCCCCCWSPFPRMLSPAYFFLRLPVHIWVFIFWQQASQRQLSFNLRSWKSLLQHKN